MCYTVTKYRCVQKSPTEAVGTPRRKRRPTPGLVGLALSAALIGFVTDGQVLAPAFDVASVKPYNPRAVPSAPDCRNGRLSASITIYYLVRKAYDLRFPQFAELDQQLPAWAKTREGMYEIEARAEMPVPVPQCWLMLRSLLEERFKLSAHFETKQGNFYELVIAPGGHKMQNVAETDTEQGFYVKVNGNLMRTPPQVPVVRGISMADFARFLSAEAPDQLDVVDKTGLEGLYKINLAFSTDPFQYPDPDLGTALLKQLGLKLERRKGPVQHFVLDHTGYPLHSACPYR